VVAGSADFVANNIAFMLNLTDWLAEDEALINIRTKAMPAAPLEPPPPDRARLWRLLNLLGGSALLGIFAGLRWWSRRVAAGGAA
jgi:ABC-type uncharacterized transport system involved in gliding motility auxiliary subunit